MQLQVILLNKDIPISSSIDCLNLKSCQAANDKQFFTKIEFSHKGTKTQRKNAMHFLCFVPLWLRGKSFFAAKRRKK